MLGSVSNLTTARLGVTSETVALASKRQHELWTVLTAYATQESTTVAHAGGVIHASLHESTSVSHAATESYGAAALGGSWSMAIASKVLMPSMHNPDHAGMKGTSGGGLGGAGTAGGSGDGQHRLDVPFM